MPNSIPNENEETIHSEVLKVSEMTNYDENLQSTATLQSVEEAELHKMRMQKDFAANELIE